MAEVKMENIAPNSYKYKAEQAKEKAKPVVKKSQVVSTKKPLGNKVKSAVFAEDVKDIGGWLIWDTIIPGLKNLFLDMIEMALLGKVDDRRRDRRSRTDYRGVYDRGSRYSYRDSGRRRSVRDRDRERDEPERDDDVDYANIILKHRDDADDVVHEMKQRIRKDGAVTIGDLFDMIDVAGEYTDNDWGWDDERDIKVTKVSNGWLIDVAKPRYVG